MPPGEGSKKSVSRRLKWSAIALVICSVAGTVIWFWTQESPSVQFQHGLAALASADLQRVLDVARALSKQRGFEPHSHLLRGAYLLRRGQPRESLDDFRQALDHDHTRVRAQVLAGEALARLNQHLRATEVLRQALTSEPDNIEAHRWASVAFYDLGAMEDAVHHLERLAKLAVDDPRPHRMMGLIYKDLENDQLAARCYEESLRRSVNQPDVEMIRTGLAEVQIRLNRHAAARETLAACSPSARVLSLKAECEHALGNQTAAEDLLKAALQQDAHEPAALLLQGTLALNNGQPEQAVASFQKVVELIPMDFTARFKLSQALGQLGDDARSRAELVTMNRIKQLRQEAAQIYQQALQNPRDAEARFRLGLLSEKLSRPDLARMWYQAALAVEPTHSPALSALNSLGPPNRDELQAAPF